MTITRTLKNASSETAESVNIKPFDRTAWVEVDSTPRNAEISALEERVAGEDPLYPLVSRISISPTEVFHPDHPKQRMSGRSYKVKTFTHCQQYDDVSGDTIDFPVNVTIVIDHGGPVLLDTTDLLDFVLTTASRLYPSVSTGTPATTSIAKLAIGAVDLE